MFSMDKNHYRMTPRRLSESKFGPYAKLEEAKKESVAWYVAAGVVMVAIVFIACWRG